MICEITVVKRSSFEDLQRLYSPAPKLGPCLLFEDGARYVVHDEIDFDSLPDQGFCPSAHKTIRDASLRILRGESLAGWSKQGNLAIISCADGMHPVVFRIEGKEQEMRA